jgi:hypothetical protein
MFAQHRYDKAHPELIPPFIGHLYLNQLKRLVHLQEFHFTKLARVSIIVWIDTSLMTRDQASADTFNYRHEFPAKSLRAKIAHRH